LSLGAFGSGSGPAVTRLFQRLLALVFVVAWLSLGVQIQVLVGSRGLLPASDLVRAVAERPDVSFLRFPTLFRHDASDAALSGGIAVGVVLALLALFRIAPRLAFAASTVLYLSYAVICRDFLAFQWDNLLIECGALATLLSPRRHRLAHFLFRVLLFKLYFESGLAKYQSYLGDWKDGSAMSFYYETAPLPTALAWYAHQLPAAWHAIESRGALVLELVVPVFVFLPRPFRLTACAALTGFQVMNIATANYGFFSYLAIALHAFLLDDRDVEWLGRPFVALRRSLRARFGDVARALRVARVNLIVAERRTRRLLRRPFDSLRSADTDTLVFLVRLTAGSLLTLAYLAVSFEDALGAFTSAEPASSGLQALSETVAPLRIVNVYHLFGHITRERIEPTFATSNGDDAAKSPTGDDFTEHDLRYKPGDPLRAPPFVAPHQPRVDFLLWFYGLSYERGVPLYVRNLLVRMCDDPEAVQSLFATPLPRRPKAAQVRFYRYHFTTPHERGKTGAVWKRTPLGEPRTLSCIAE
jgi:hypothetical protein